MLINVKNIPAYCLNFPSYVERRNNIETMCKSLNMEVTFIESATQKYSHQQNLSSDAISLMHTAMCVGKYPFIIFEDDATIIDGVPVDMNIPDVCDLIYLGSNKASGPPVIKQKMYITEFDDNYYRVYNSQSGHALLVPSLNSALFLRSVYLQSLAENEFSDVILPNLSDTKIFLIHKDGPFFYQKDKHENITKFKIKDFNVQNN